MNVDVSFIALMAKGKYFEIGVLENYIYYKAKFHYHYHQHNFQ